MKQILNQINQIKQKIESINFRITMYLYTQLYFKLIKQMSLINYIKLWIIIHIIYFILLILDQTLFLSIENYHPQLSSITNSIIETKSSLSLVEAFQWRLIGNSDLSNITESDLVDGWQNHVLANQNLHIFNPLSHAYWSDNNTPLSHYYIVDLGTGELLKLKEVWPVADSKLENLGLPSLPIQEASLKNGLNILHERVLSGQNTDNSSLNILRYNKLSPSSLGDRQVRVLEWLKDQQTHKLDVNNNTKMFTDSSFPSLTSKPSLFSEDDYNTFRGNIKGLDLQ